MSETPGSTNRISRARVVAECISDTGAGKTGFSAGRELSGAWASTCRSSPGSAAGTGWRGRAGEFLVPSRSIEVFLLANIQLPQDSFCG